MDDMFAKNNIPTCQMPLVNTDAVLCYITGRPYTPDAAPVDSNLKREILGAMASAASGSIPANYQSGATVEHICNNTREPLQEDTAVDEEIVRGNN